MKVAFELIHPHAVLPKRMTRKAAGYDVFSPVKRLLHAGQRIVVPTGLRMEMPTGVECQVRPRSGLAHQYVAVINSPGTIDSDYRGELGIMLINHHRYDSYVVQRGDRIAQLVFAPVLSPDLFEGKLSETERGEGGFGSTGR
jgi:dUTP pyrophosphatase